MLIRIAALMIILAGDAAQGNEVSFRLGLGGAVAASPAAVTGAFDFAPRLDFLFSPIRKRLQLGFLAEYRTASFTSAELSGAVVGAFHFDPKTLWDPVLLIAPGGGWASRAGGASGPQLCVLVSFGLRENNYNPYRPQGVTATLTDAFYVSYRHTLGPLPRDEVSFGIDLGLGLLLNFARQASSANRG